MRRPAKKKFTMSKIPSIAFLIVGIILLVYGLDASNSVSSSVSNAVTGSPTDKSIWLIVLGVIGILSGGFGLFFRRSQ
jgi:LPXTG-motif cell wall-anchored protein